MDPNTVAETVAATPYGYAIAMIGVAMCVFLCGIGSCIGLFKSSAAAAGVLSENPKLFGKVLVLVLLPATQGIYGFIIGIIASGALGDTAMGTVEGWALLGAVLPWRSRASFRASIRARRPPTVSTRSASRSPFRASSSSIPR